MEFKINTPVAFGVHEGLKAIKDATNVAILVILGQSGEYGKYEEAHIIEQTVLALNNYELLKQENERLKEALRKIVNLNKESKFYDHVMIFANIQQAEQSEDLAEFLLTAEKILQ